MRAKAASSGSWKRSPVPAAWLKAAWAEENERRRILAEQQIAEQAEPKGLLASIRRKVFGE